MAKKKKVSQKRSFEKIKKEYMWALIGLLIYELSVSLLSLIINPISSLSEFPGYLVAIVVILFFGGYVLLVGLNAYLAKKGSIFAAFLGVVSASLFFFGNVIDAIIGIIYSVYAFYYLDAYNKNKVKNNKKN